MVFPVVMHGCEIWTIKKWSDEELMLLNSGVGEDSLSLSLSFFFLQFIKREFKPAYINFKVVTLHYHFKSWLYDTVK